jgi:hypothetical protein
MSTTIPEHYTTQFGLNWEFLLQQMESRLREYVTVDSVTGKERSYNQMGTSTARLITTRNGPTVPNNETFDKRWLRLQAYESVTHFDEFDAQLLGQISLPTSETVKSHAMAFNRTCDELIINALGGTVYTGPTGVTAQTLDSTAVAADYKDLTSLTGGGTDYNLTIQKLVRARQILEQEEAFDPRMGDQLCIAVSANQIAGLLSDAIEVQSSDYSAVKSLYDGQLDTFAGFRFVRTELLGYSTGTVRQCFAWVKSGIVLGFGQERGVRMAIRDDLSETLQIRSKMILGTTRLMEEKVVSILCEETAASTV